MSAQPQMGYLHLVSLKKELGDHHGRWSVRMVRHRVWGASGLWRRQHRCAHKFTVVVLACTRPAQTKLIISLAWSGKRFISPWTDGNF